MENPQRTLERKGLWLMSQGLTPAQVAQTTGLSYYWLALAKKVYSKVPLSRDGLSVSMPTIKSIH